MKFNYIFLTIIGLFFVTSNAKLAVREMNDGKEMSEEDLKEFVKDLQHKPYQVKPLGLDLDIDIDNVAETVKENENEKENEKEGKKEK